MAYWLSRGSLVNDIWTPLVVQSQRSQWPSLTLVEDWIDCRKDKDTVSGYAIVYTERVRAAWHTPPSVYGLGEQLTDVVIESTRVDLSTALERNFKADATVRQAIRWILFHHPRLVPQPPVGANGMITVSLGPHSATFSQDDEPVLAKHPTGVQTYPPHPRYG